MTTVFYEDLDKICRACLCKNGKMRPLFGSCLDSMLRVVAEVEIQTGDGLPELLCVPCVLQVSRAFTFKQQCRRSDETLRSLFTQKQIIDEDETINDVEQLISGQELSVGNYNDDEGNQIVLSSNEAMHSIPSQIATSSFGEQNVPSDYTTAIDTTVVESSIIETQLNITSIEDNTKQIVSTKFREYFEEIKLKDVPLADSETDCIRDAFDNYSSIESNSNGTGIEPEPSKNDEMLEALASKSRTNEDEMMKIVCSICSQHFYEQISYENHIQSIHSNENETIAIEESEEKIEAAEMDVNENTKKRGFECPECHKVFNENKVLKRHLKIHSPIKPHVCSICNMSFTESSNLSKHLKKHTGELRNVVGKPNLCSVCGKGFKWSSSLSKHMKHHTKHKVLNCPYCDKYYVEARSLNIHMRSHTGEKPFVCSICQKAFTQMGNLEKHVRVHTGEKPYNCPICHKGFSQSGYVAIHLRTHTGEKPYTCNECGKSFAGSNTLAIHKRTHTGERPYGCTMCEKTFARQETAIIHQRTHTGEKPHICKLCNRGFTSSGHLTGHMRSHSGIKTHECKICQKRFAGSSSLRVHMKTHSEKVANTVSVTPTAQEQQQQQQDTYENKTIFECSMCKMNIPSTALTSPDELQAYDHEFIDDVLICSNVASIIDTGKIIEEIHDENGSNIILTTANDIGNSQQLIINLSDLK